VQGDALLLCVAGDHVGLARELGFEFLASREQLAPVVVEAGVLGVRERAEFVAVAVAWDDRQFRLGGAKRHLLAAPVDASGENPVLELVLAGREVGSHDARFACLPKPVEELAVVALGRLLGLAQHVALSRREEIAIALDDGRLLGGFLLPHAHGTTLFGALEEIAREALFVLRRRADGRNAH